MVFASSFDPQPLEVLCDLAPPNLLFSYAFAELFARITYTPPFLLFDSGAFSLWQAGKPADLHGYGRFAQALLAPRKAKGLITRCVNLDVIPGEVGRTSTPDERKFGMRDSLRNADVLRAEYGLPIIEVFHQDEPMEFLDVLLDRLPAGGMLGISPRNDVSPKARAAWLSEVLRYLTGPRGLKLSQLPRCHGLAVTCRECHEAFPFYTVDSSTWAGAFRFGRVITAKGRQLNLATDGQFPSSKALPAKRLTTHRNLLRLNAMADYATAFWAQRGLVWDA